MNQFTFADMVNAIRSNRKIEAIKHLRDLISTHTEAVSLGTDSHLKFCKDFIEAISPHVANQPEDNKPFYRFGVVYRGFAKDIEYAMHMTEAEATAAAVDILANPDFDVDYVHVVEIKQVARAKTVYEMKPYID